MQKRRVEITNHYKKAEADEAVTFRGMLDHLHRMKEAALKSEGLPIHQLSQYYPIQIEEALHKELLHYRQTPISYELGMPTKLTRGYFASGTTRKIEGQLNSALPDLPPRVLTGSEIKGLKDICR